MKLWKLYESQPPPLKQIIGPLEYTKVLLRENVIQIDPNDNRSCKLLRPYAIPRINLEIWLDSYTFFKPFTKRGKYHAPVP